MLSVKITVLVAFLIFFDPSDAWRRRRRRRCTPRDCQVSSWSSWSLCTAAQCGQQGSQSRSRQEESSSSCGGAECPDLQETRQCYSSKRVDCELSSWSEWSACTTCGVSGTQHSARHRIITEQCGGTCTSTFRKTRACQELSCLNGGTLKDGSCFCKEGYSGNCCEKGFDKNLFLKIFTPCTIACVLLVGLTCYYWKIKKREEERERERRRQEEERRRRPEEEKRRNNDRPPPPYSAW